MALGLSLGFGLGPANPRRSTAFTPLSLTPALWIDPSDTATMFQSNAGTTTVTDTSVCGYAGDKSGNAKHFTSLANNTTRPTWNNNSGKPYLNFDGTDDVLRNNTDMGFYSAGALSTFIAVRGNPALNTYLFVSTETNGGAYYGIAQSSNGSASDSKIFMLNDASSVRFNSDLALGIWNNADVVYGVVDDGSSITPYVNGVAGTTVPYTRSGALTLSCVTLGGLVIGGAGGNWFGARIYELVSVKRVLTAPEIVSLNSYLSGQM